MDRETAGVSDTNQTHSFWMTTAEVPRFAPLREDVECDVCIVGAGIVGMTTAYLLSRAKKRVVVLDDGPIGGGETGRTTAHLAFALDDFYTEIEKMHGAEGARIAAASHMAAVSRIESIVREEKIECGFERLDGYWFAEDANGAQELDEEAEAARRAGIPGVSRMAQIPGVAFKTSAALCIADQAQFHPLKYLAALARAITRDGGRIFCGSHAAELENRPPRPSVRTSDGRTVTAAAIVFATNSPVNDWVKMHTKQAAYRTYVVAMRIPAGSVAPGLYWDNLDPYHYVRIASEGADDTLIVGGQDHKTGQADDQEERFEALVEWARKRFPTAGAVTHKWSGQIIEPNDYMAFIGRNPGDDNIFIATGDSGNGITHGTVAGILLTDLITGRENPWGKLYDPSRISLRATPEFLRENLNVAAQYRDYATPGEISELEALARNCGAVIRRGAKKVALYKDAQGGLHERSAICPHLYCIVDWNDAEKTWDCPCHGSRFDRYGKVINGPAISDLAALEREA
jgi:glycine/D-amino acid oxidase-like deaminating enzyme/nitrite reductase/ring-hydroxylating ferredoxin subunit